jgi:Helix-turn-helix domain
VRLDEWQKYIDSQFLDEESEPVPAPTASKILAEAAKSEPPLNETASAETIPQTALFAAEPENVEEAEDPVPAVLTTPETALSVVQNMVTMVVSPPQPPVLPTGRAPRIEILTPLPTAAPEPKPLTPATEEVTNRTRRRSHVVDSSPVPHSDTPSDIPSSASDSLFSELLSSEINTAAPDPVAIQPMPVRGAVTPIFGLFEPISDLDADIPVFQQYLPSSHAAALPVEAPASNGLQTQIPFLPETQDDNAEEKSDLPADPPLERVRRAPKSRARHARNVRPENVQSGLSAAELWAAVPRHVQTLLSLERLEEKEVAQFSYKRQFQEKRHELIERLLDPILSLEDTARLLNVCPTTVRRYTNKGILTYYRKEPERSLRNGGETAVANEKETRQRRFRLSDILAFLETQQAAIASDRQDEHQADRRLARAANTIAAPPTEPDVVSNAPHRGKDS